MVDRYVIWSDRESGECTWIRDDVGAFVQFRDYASLEQRAVLAEMTAQNIARDRDHADSRFFEMQAERDALAAQVESISKELLLTRQAAHRGMDAAKKGSSIQLQLAEKARAESSPDALASEREANSILTAENERLTAQVEALKKDAGRWRFLLDNLQDLRGTAEMRIGKFAVMGRIDKYRIQEFKDADEFRQTIDAAREQK